MGAESLNPKQFQQLQMLMKPSEVTAHVEDYDNRYDDQTVDDVRQEALTDADERGWSPRSLSEQIETDGVREPIEVSYRWGGRPTLADGHHRLFVAERMEQRGKETYLPVQWSD